MRVILFPYFGKKLCKSSLITLRKWKFLLVAQFWPLLHSGVLKWAPANLRRGTIWAPTEFAICQPKNKHLIQSCASWSGNRTHSCSTSSTIFDRSFQNSITFIRISCFSDPQLHALYIYMTIFENLNHSCHGSLIANSFILQYQNNITNTEIYFFYFAILYMPGVIEDTPFSNVTRIHWPCDGHNTIFSNSLSRVC